MENSTAVCVSVCVCVCLSVCLWVHVLLVGLDAADVVRAAGEELRDKLGERLAELSAGRDGALLADGPDRGVR